jgi:hypothetical protein
MERLVRPIVLVVLVLLAFAALPASLQAQALPTPRSFVSNLDVRCYKIPNQQPLGITLRLDHLNPYFIQKQLPFETVGVREPQDLCVPVQKESQVPPPDALPFLKYVDWKCYGITGPSLDLPVHLDQLNPVIVNLFGPSDDVIVREPQQVCVPVAKNNVVPPASVAQLINWLDVKCYRVDSQQAVGTQPIRLTHLNPLWSTVPPETANFAGLPPNQLCVPVSKNKQAPPSSVLPIVQYSDVLCYPIRGLALNQQLTLTHLNPVLRSMGLPPENVLVTDTDKLCVPVAKNGFFPPG